MRAASWTSDDFRHFEPKFSAENFGGNFGGFSAGFRQKVSADFRLSLRFMALMRVSGSGSAEIIFDNKNAEGSLEVRAAMTHIA